MELLVDISLKAEFHMKNIVVSILMWRGNQDGRLPRVC